MTKDETIAEIKGYLSGCSCYKIERMRTNEKPGFFYESKNEFLMNLKNFFLESLSNTPDLQIKHESLKSFTKSYFSIGESVVRLLLLSCKLLDNIESYEWNSRVVNASKNKWNLWRLKFDNFTHLSDLPLQIRANFQAGETILAYKKRQYILNVINGMLQLFKVEFDVDLSKSSFKYYFNDFKKEIGNSIPQEELKEFINLNKDILLKSNTTDKSQQSTETNIKKNEFGFINKFDSITEKIVYEYFYKKLVETKHLTDEVLVGYLISAFQECEKPKLKFTLNNKISNKNIQAIFYNYYKNIAGKPHGKQEVYIELLGEYFVGFNTNTLKTNFSKTY